jgi:hypothetical protein
MIVEVDRNLGIVTGYMLADQSEFCRILNSILRCGNRSPDLLQVWLATRSHSTAPIVLQRKGGFPYLRISVLA